MVGEQGCAATIDTGEAIVFLRRCVQCGEVIDPVILKNRRLRLGNDLSRTQMEETFEGQDVSSVNLNRN
jgi:hypothetical protein